MFSFNKKNKYTKHKDIKINEDVIYKNEYITLLKCNLNDLKLNEINNWKYNRPVDELRSSDICDYFIKNNTMLIPGIIFAWKTNYNYIIFDGIHRFMAGVKSGNNMTMLLQIYNTQDEEIIKQEFLNINKSVCLPCIYTEFDNDCKKKICENIVNMLIKKYPSFQSPSRNCFKYNYNRDNFVEFISTLNIDFTKRDIDIDVFNTMMILNSAAENSVIKNKITVPKKVSYNKFYLMYFTNEYIKKQIEDALN